jgi:hypothetical protein
MRGFVRGDAQQCGSVETMNGIGSPQRRHDYRQQIITKLQIQ